MQTIAATRAELLARKERLELAGQGREMLERKRAALLKEVLRLAGRVMERSETLHRAAARAQQALTRAEAEAGPEAVRSAALAARAQLALDIQTTNVMGVRLPQIEEKSVARPMFGRGYAIVGTSLTIDEAAAAFEAEVEVILRLANSILRLRRLTDEIERITRRVNALEQVLIPRLEAECELIEFRLDERERADHFRLKLAKRRLESRSHRAIAPIAVAGG
jgi:V/A-type H+-transporting ATPase subunit D